MQSALQTGNDNDTVLVTAEALREMTITKEALFDKQKASVLDQLMASMVRIASESGGNSYTANLNPQFDVSLLAAVKEEFEKLGYKTVTEAKSDKVLITEQNPSGTFVSITISW
jgi:predicted Zn-dependent protease